MIDNHKIFKTHKILKAICFLNRKIDNFNNFYFTKASSENISNIKIYNWIFIIIETIFMNKKKGDFN
jgi:hypothetical protein